MLESARQISPPSWMTEPQTQAVMQALDEGRHPKALFVGGCVRNTVLELPEGDIDIATTWNPEQVTERLQNAGIRVVPTGIEHGTVTAVVMGRHFEITTLRRDVETDGRRAVIAFTDSWGEDAQRRDFTMNTLLADIHGHIYDPTGRGLDDLHEGRVIFVGDPAQRIAEDYLRILRFFRFYASYGRGVPDPQAIKACRAAAAKITTLSRERITQEFLRILAMEDPVAVLDLMFENKILAELPAKNYNPQLLSDFCVLQKQYGVPDVVARLLVLADFSPENILRTQDFIVFNNNMKRSVASTLQALQETGVITEASARALIYKYGSQYALQALLLAVARDNPQDDIIIPLVARWDPPLFPLAGSDVMALGIESGVKVGSLLRDVKNWWVSEDFRPGREQCLKKLQQLVKK